MLTTALKLQLDDLTDLGRLYLQSKHPLDTVLGRDLLLCASRAGSSSATVFLVHSARKLGVLNTFELTKPKALLKKLVQSETASVQALVLQGILYQDQKLDIEAAALFKKAIAQPRQDKYAHEAWWVKPLERIGLDLAVKDPNLDSSRPEDLELDVAQAHMHLSTLQYDSLNEPSAALENLKVAALEYDDPAAYFLLAGTFRKFSYEWLEHMRKAAASGHSSAMEYIAELHGYSEEDLENIVDDEKVRDWVLNNPLFDHPDVRAFYNISSDRKKCRTIWRYSWASDWHMAAMPRAEKGHKTANYSVAKLYWSISDIREELASPLDLVRKTRVLAVDHMKAVLQIKGVGNEFKKKSELVWKDMLQEPTGQEAEAIWKHWTSQKCPITVEWLFRFLKSINHVPAGTWKPGKKN